MADLDTDFKAINEALRNRTVKPIDAKDANEHARFTFNHYLSWLGIENVKIYSFNDYVIFEIGIPEIKYLATHQEAEEYIFWSTEEDGHLEMNEVSAILIKHVHPSIKEYKIINHPDGTRETICTVNGKSYRKQVEVDDSQADPETKEYSYTNHPDGSRETIVVMQNGRHFRTISTQPTDVSKWRSELWIDGTYSKEASDRLTIEAQRTALEHIRAGKRGSEGYVIPDGFELPNG